MSLQFFIPEIKSFTARVIGTANPTTELAEATNVVTLVATLAPALTIPFVIQPISLPAPDCESFFPIGPEVSSFFKAPPITPLAFVTPCVAAATPLVAPFITLE